MIYPKLSKSEAKAFLENKRLDTGQAPQLAEGGFGSRGVKDNVAKAVAAVDAVIASLPEDMPRAKAHLVFESVAASKFRSRLPLNPLTAADDSFWRYVACVEMYAAVKWRHGNQEGISIAALGIGGEKWECLPRRLWYRAELVADPGREDVYELSRRGGRDFWKSGLLSKVYSSTGSLARALVEFQFPDEGSFSESGSYRPQTLQMTAARELYKRIRHFDSIVSFSALDSRGASKIISELAADLCDSD